MECLLGLLKVRVVRGVHLAICDPLTHSSDPYVVLRHGQQVIKLQAAPATSFDREPKSNGFFFSRKQEGHWPLLKFIKQKQKAITITDKKIRF
jgi:hypothetical protein